MLTLEFMFGVVVGYFIRMIVDFFRNLVPSFLS